MKLLSLGCVMLVVTSLVTLGCRQRAVPANQRFQVLFDGYQLILVTELRPDKAVDEVDVSKLQGSLPLEPRLVPGRIYVFRKVSHVSTEDMAIKIFPERLVKIGARVTKAPRSPEHLIYLMIGGPLFNIEFELEGHRGKIFNYSTSDYREDRLVFAYR